MGRRGPEIIPNEYSRDIKVNIYLLIESNDT